MLCTQGRNSHCGSSFHTTPHLFTRSESTTAGKPCFHLSTNELRRGPFSHNYKTCTLAYIYMDQSKLHNSDASFTQKDLIENLDGNFHYKRCPLLCLCGTQLKLLPKSMSPGWRCLLKWMLFILHGSLKCIVVYTTLTFIHLNLEKIWGVLG